MLKSFTNIRLVLYIIIIFKKVQEIKIILIIYLITHVYKFMERVPRPSAIGGNVNYVFLQRDVLPHFYMTHETLEEINISSQYDYVNGKEKKH